MYAGRVQPLKSNTCYGMALYKNELTPNLDANLARPGFHCARSRSTGLPLRCDMSRWALWTAAWDTQRCKIALLSRLHV
jgi:hypothetical protein